MDKHIILFTTLLAASSLVVLLKKRRRRFAVRPMNRNRNVDGHYASLVQDMLNKEPDFQQFFKYTRMTPNQFNYLVNMVAPKLKKDETRHPISPSHRLIMTLHYLAEGCSMQEIAWGYRVGKTTVHNVLSETCAALWECLSPIILSEPSMDDWKDIVAGYFNRWNMPNCFGAVDGKHVQIQSPKFSGSHYFNYKKSFSIVLMACCDAFYRFTLVDIGANGSNHDSSVFSESAFGRAILQQQLNIPPPSNLPNTNIMVPHFVIADQAFPLHEHIMRPYPGEKLGEAKNIFNYRLSRARRTIENTFGILVQRWRVLRKPIVASVEMCEKFVKTTIVLHNFLQKAEADLAPEERRYCPTGFADTITADGRIILGTWRTDAIELRSVTRLGANNSRRSNQLIRDTLAAYFISDAGALAWQYAKVRKGSIPESN